MTKLGFKGIQHPTKSEEIIPTLKTYLKDVVENIKKRQATQAAFEAAEVLGGFETALSLTEVETGYFYAPHGWQKAPAPPADNSHQALLTKFGKKILNEKIEKLAYYKWEAAGRPEGQDMRFWEEAEKEICIQAKA